MRDEMQAVRDKANELEIKSDKEINLLKAQVEQTKNEAIKYSLGMMLAFATAGRVPASALRALLVRVYQPDVQAVSFSGYVRCVWWLAGLGAARLVAR